MCCRRWKKALDALALPASLAKSRAFRSPHRAASALRRPIRRHGAGDSPLAQHDGEECGGRTERRRDALAGFASPSPLTVSMVCSGNTGKWIFCGCAAANRIPGLWRLAMRRVISLFLPHWPSDRLRRASKDAPPRDSPLVTAMMEGQRRIIASVDQAAAHLGLCCGMTVTHAQSLIPDLTVIDATPDDDEAALYRLAIWCMIYSPLVTPDPPDGIFIDVAGSAHLFHGEAALIADLCKRLKAEGSRQSARSPIRPAAAGAGALWRCHIVSPGRASEAIASLPVAALRLAPQRSHHCTMWALSALRIWPANRAGVCNRALAAKSSCGSIRRSAMPMRRCRRSLPPEVPRTELRFAEPLGDPEDLKRVIEKLADTLPGSGSERHRRTASRSRLHPRR